MGDIGCLVDIFPMYICHLAEAVPDEAAVDNLSVKNDGDRSAVDNVYRVPDVALTMSNL